MNRRDINNRFDSLFTKIGSLGSTLIGSFIVKMKLIKA